MVKYVVRIFSKYLNKEVEVGTYTSKTEALKVKETIYKKSGLTATIAET